MDHILVLYRQLHWITAYLNTSALNVHIEDPLLHDNVLRDIMMDTK